MLTCAISISDAVIPHSDVTSYHIPMGRHTTFLQAANKLAGLRQNASEYIKKVQLEKQAQGIPAFEFSVADVQVMIAELMSRG